MKGKLTRKKERTKKKTPKIVTSDGQASIMTGPLPSKEHHVKAVEGYCLVEQAKGKKPSFVLNG